MKTQAWGWLAAAVLAAGLNSSYHEGGLRWAHEITSRVEHNSSAVLALATGRADQFLAEARILDADRKTDFSVDTDAPDTDTLDQTVVAENVATQCPFSNAMVKVQSKIDGAKMQAISDREQARLERLEASRIRIENEVRARLARVRVRTADFNFSHTETPQVRCPRVRVNMPHMPRIQVPAPVVHLDYSGPGPV